MQDVNVTVDPARMLTVQIADPGGQREIAVVLCHYVVATDPGGVDGIAIEVGYDPGAAHPTSTYLCPAERLVYEVLVPARVTKISPYAY
jgi:hypothetical protein